MAASQALSTDDRVRVAGQEPIPQGVLVAAPPVVFVWGESGYFYT